MTGEGAAASPAALTLGELARKLAADVRGDPDVRIGGIATIEDAGADDVTWAIETHFVKKLATCRAAAVIGPRDFPPTPMPALLVADVQAAAAATLAHFAIAPTRPEVGIHPTAQVDPTAIIDSRAAVGAYAIIGPGTTVGPGCVLHPQVFVGADCRLDEGCELWPQSVVLDRCVLGKRVVLWPHAVVGRDGFGFFYREGAHRRIPQIGTVILGDDVEVGANSCVDRAKVGATVIGPGTKIDNLVQVAHNVRTGPHCVLVAKVAIAGGARLGAGVVLAGAVGVRDGVTIGDGTQVTAGSIVVSSLPPGIVADGFRAQERMKALREQAAARKLPDLLERVKELERRVRELQTAADNRKPG